MMFINKNFTQVVAVLYLKEGYFFYKHQKGSTCHKRQSAGKYTCGSNLCFVFSRGYDEG